MQICDLLVRYGPKRPVARFCQDTAYRNIFFGIMEIDEQSRADFAQQALSPLQHLAFRPFHISYKVLSGE